MNSFLLHVLILDSLLNDTPGYFCFSECLTFLIVHGSSQEDLGEWNVRDISGS